jgi:hypothetical protein
MIEQQPIIPFQNIEQGSSTQQYVDELIVFLETTLPDFTPVKQIDVLMSEEEISYELFRYFTRMTNFDNNNNRLTQPYPFHFPPEIRQKKQQQRGHAKRTDFGVHVSVESIDMQIIYCIEAKILPTGKGREKEYLIGKGGAIDRFKREEHGIDNEGKLLERNGIIAYIKANDFIHWHNQISTWVTAEESYNENEQLVPIYFREIAKLHSEHLRISGTTVKLTHFWVNIPA